MQQMNQEESGSGWHAPYGGYQGDPQYNDQFAGAPGQKLSSDDDEQFAELLARTIKQEFKDELRSARGPSAGQRLALAIVSLCLLVPLLGLFIGSLPLLQATGNAAAVFAWGIAAICGTIVIVNVLFNFSGGSRDSKRNEKP